MYPRHAIDHGPTPRRQIKRMSAGKTISLYLESRERSLPVRGGEEVFQTRSLFLSIPLSFFPSFPRILVRILLYPCDQMEADSLLGINDVLRFFDEKLLFAGHSQANFWYHSELWFLEEPLIEWRIDIDCSLQYYAFHYFLKWATCRLSLCARKTGKRRSLAMVWNTAW